MGQLAKALEAKSKTLRSIPESGIVAVVQAHRVKEIGSNQVPKHVHNILLCEPT